MLWNLPYSELSKTFMDLMVWKYRFDKERYVKQINDIREQQKKVEFCRLAVKGHVWKESRVMTQGRIEVKVAILLLNNNKNVTVENVLSYF